MRDIGEILGYIIMSSMLAFAFWLACVITP